MANIPEYVKIIPESDRNEDNSYLIPNATGYVFPFSVPQGCYLQFTIGDTYLQRRQDLAMHVWFGFKPWNKAEIDINLPYNNLHLRRHPTDFIFYEKGTMPPTEFHDPRPKHLVPIPIDTTLYANIYNEANQENSFDLIFQLENASD